MALGCGPDQAALHRQHPEHRSRESLARFDLRMSQELARTDAIDAMYERKAWADIRRGWLGPRARDWLSRADASATLEGLIQGGRPKAELSIAVSDDLNLACGAASAVEPFAAPLRAFGVVAARSAIEALPAVPGIADAHVITRELGHAVDRRTGVDDRGWLITWLYEGALVGFVYHSKTALTLAEVHERVPALVGVLQAALPKPTR